MDFGYLHANYAHALADIGTPQYLPAAQGWILRRSIPASAHWDATGGYPFLACRNWQQLGASLAQLPSDCVSFTMVTDPLGAWTVQELLPAFPAVLRPYKEHFIVDRSRPLSIVAHHRRNLRQALAQLTVEHCEPASAFADWTRLYAYLVARHQITGAANFSSASFAWQWQVPGLTILRAVHQGETVGMTLWFRQDERVYYHLAAYSARGYELKASYALFASALEYFADARYIALGAGAGVDNDGSDGLTRFKRGWANATRTVYLCGRILNAPAYAVLAGEQTSATFFPAYRSPQKIRCLTPERRQGHAA